jgi:hypothetical protein
MARVARSASIPRAKSGKPELATTLGGRDEASVAARVGTLLGARRVLVTRWFYSPQSLRLPEPARTGGRLSEP